MVSTDARVRPIAQRATFEAQILTEVLRQDESRMPVHHEGDAGKTAPIPRRAVDLAQDSRRQSQPKHSGVARTRSAHAKPTF